MECMKDDSALLDVHPELDRLEKALLNALEPYCVTYELEWGVIPSATLPFGYKIFIRPSLPIDQIVMKDRRGAVGM